MGASSFHQDTSNTQCIKCGYNNLPAKCPAHGKNVIIVAINVTLQASAGDLKGSAPEKSATPRAIEDNHTPDQAAEGADNLNHKDQHSTEETIPLQTLPLRWPTYQHNLKYHQNLMTLFKHTACSLMTKLLILTQIRSQTHHFHTHFTIPL